MPTTSQIQARAELLADRLRQMEGRFRMSDWFTVPVNTLSYSQPGASLDAVDSIDIHACGTTACLAGHTALLMRDVGVLDDLDVDAVFKHDTVLTRVSDWLGIPPHPSGRSCPLFYRTEWNGRVDSICDRHLRRVDSLHPDPFSEAERMTLICVLDAVAETGDWTKWITPDEPEESED